MHLTKILPLCQRCVLDHAAPALCVRETRVANSVENFVAGVDGCDRAVAGVFGYFSRGKKG